VGWSRELPGFYSGPLHEYLQRVLTWVVESMLNLKRVACLGDEAWLLTSNAFVRPDVSWQFSRYRDSYQPLSGTCAGKPITAFALFHPAARVSNDAKRSGWAAMTGGATPRVITTTDERRPEEAAIDRMAKKEKQMSTDWTDAPFRLNKTDKSASGTIHLGMVRLLEQAGESGVPWKEFGGLPWKAKFCAGLVDEAMNKLANLYGYPLQYQVTRSSEAYPERWRIAP